MRWWATSRSRVLPYQVSYSKLPILLQQHKASTTIKGCITYFRPSGGDQDGDIYEKGLGPHKLPFEISILLRGVLLLWPELLRCGLMPK
uniref:Uncharacterized protein n=1 Tax=Oryza nivara TaxID=4536 RepID=A0A0E0I259_ORYNI